jgi:glyoxylase-like metal-dependent hydrolase (beta-lactamase superfamily II)
MSDFNSGRCLAPHRRISTTQSVADSEILRRASAALGAGAAYGARRCHFTAPPAPSAQRSSAALHRRNGSPMIRVSRDSSAQVELVAGVERQPAKHTAGPGSERPPAAALDYPWAQAPGPGEVCPVAPGVYWLRMPLPFALDHINLWLLEDGAGWTVVDTGVARDDVKLLWDRLRGGPMGGRSILRVIVTHHHPDHLGLAGWLGRQADAPAWMTRTEWLTGTMLHADADARLAAHQVDFFRRNGLDDERARALAERGNRYRRLVSPPPEQYRRLIDGDTIIIGGRTWRVVVAQGHSPEHACLHCEELRLLIAGDQVLPQITPNVSVPAAEPQADPLALFLDSLGRLRALREDTLVLPSHGRPFYGLRERIDRVCDHHETRLAALAGVCDEPRSAADLLTVLFRRELDPHQLMFAMGEALSHLNHLEARGRLARETDVRGIVHFRRA